MVKDDAYIFQSKPLLTHRGLNGGDWEAPRPRPSHSSLWSIPLLCAGLSIIAVCVLVPQMELNRRLMAERNKLQADLDYTQRQLAMNDEFLKHVGADSGLAERLAQRQMKMIRQGTSVLELPGQSAGQEMSPFLLVSVGPPPGDVEYPGPRGVLGGVCATPRRQLYFSGLGMLMAAAGLVLGVGSGRS